jgi:hypothetical protein
VTYVLNFKTPKGTSELDYCMSVERSSGAELTGELGLLLKRKGQIFKHLFNQFSQLKKRKMKLALIELDLPNHDLTLSVVLQLIACP